MEGTKPPPRGVGPPSGKRHGEDAGAASKEHPKGSKEAEDTQGTSKVKTSMEEQQKTGKQAKDPRGSEDKGTKKVWGNPMATKALLFAPAPSTAQYEDERKYAEEYACARRPHDVVASDSCRPMTALEKRTLFLWRKGILRLASPPAFTNETHTLNQRTRNLQVQRDHLFARLYLLLNPGQKLRQNGAKWHFCNAMLGLNADAEITDKSANEFLSTAYSFRCSASSPLVEFFFVRKEHRDHWAGKTLKLPGGEVTLHATDAFSKEGKGASYDKVAMELLHEYRFSGGDYAKPGVILAIARAISKGIAVHSLRTEDPTGKGFYNNQVWIVTLDSTVGPEELTKIREIVATCGQEQYKLGLHQPRLARHPPCHTCLDDNHPRHRCPLAEPTKENIERREVMRAPRQLVIEVEEPFSFPIAEVPDSEEAFLEMQEREFARLEPEIMKARTAEAAAAAAAAAAEIETAKAELLQLETEKEARKAVDVTAAAAAQKSDGEVSSGGGTAAEQVVIDATTTKESATKDLKGIKKKSKADKGKRIEENSGASTGDVPLGKVKSAPATKKKDEDGGEIHKREETASREKAEKAHKAKIAAEAKAKAEAEEEARREAATKQKVEADAKAAAEARAKAQAAEETRARAEAAAKKQKEAADAMASEKAQAEADRKKKNEEAELARIAATAASEKAKQLTAAADDAVRAAEKAAAASREAAEAAAACEAQEVERQKELEELADRAAGELAAKLHKAMQEAVKQKACGDQHEGDDRAGKKGLLSPSVSSLTRAILAANKGEQTGTTSNEEESKEEGGSSSKDEHTQSDSEEEGGEGEDSESMQTIPRARFNVDLDEAASARAASKREDKEHPDEAMEEHAAEAESEEKTTEEQVQQSALCVMGGSSEGKAERKKEERAERRKAKRQARQARKAAQREEARAEEEKRRAALLDRLAAELEERGFDFDGGESDGDDFEPTRPKLDLESRPTGQVKGKRTRVETADDPSAVGRPTPQPQTRQARTMTAHEHVVSTTSEGFIAAVRARANGKKANGGTPGKQKTQLSVAAFLQQKNTEEGESMEVDQEDAEDHAIKSTTKQIWTDEEWRLARFEEFLERLDLHEVSTPSNGSCLAYACHAMKAAHLDALEIPATRNGLTEATFYRKQLALYIIDHFDELIGSDAFPLSEASRILLGTAEVNEQTRDNIIAHLRKDARQCCKTACGREYWGTELHIRALAHWCREPVYVCTVMPNHVKTAWEMAVQRYSFHHETATVQTESVTVSDTARCMKIYHANKVLPLMLVLRVSWDKDGALTSHFNGVRVHQEHYQAWSGSKRQAAAMTRRLRHVVEEIKAQRLGTPVEVELEAVYRSPEDNVSLYEPSSEDEETAETDESQGAKVKYMKSMQDHAETGARAKEEVVDLTSLSEKRTMPETEAFGSVSSTKHSATPLSVQSGADTLELPGSPATQLTTKEHESLLLRLGDVDEISRAEWIYRLLHKAEVANRMAYAEWQRSASGSTDPKLARVMGHLTPTVACVACSDDAVALLPLLHKLPYAQVLLATMDHDVISRIGEAVECEGHRQMLRRLENEPGLDEHSRSYCKQWADVIEHLPSLAMKRRESEKIESWHRLRHHVKQKARTPMSSERIAQFIPRREWLHALAFAAALPQHLPQELRCEAPDRFCDELLYWITRNGQIDFTKGVGIALVARQWDAIDVLFGVDAGGVEDAPHTEWYKTGRARDIVQGPNRS